MTLPAAVLAGGLASRLGEMARGVPKVLVEVEGRPFAEHQVELLHRQGIRSVVYCVGHLGDQVEAQLGDGRRWGMAFRYAWDDPRPAGTGGALVGALPLVGHAFFVIYGDSYLECDFAAVEAAFRRSGQPALMTVVRNDDRWDRSNVEYQNGRILRYDKAGAAAGMRHIDYGLGILTPAAFDDWREAARPFDLGAVYAGLAARGALAGHEVYERFFEIGSPAGLEAARAHLAGRKPASSD